MANDRYKRYRIVPINSEWALFDRSKRLSTYKTKRQAEEVLDTILSASNDLNQSSNTVKMKFELNIS
jgi:hemerythrin superfamily protein